MKKVKENPAARTKNANILCVGRSLVGDAITEQKGQTHTLIKKRFAFVIVVVLFSFLNLFTAICMSVCRCDFYSLQRDAINSSAGITLHSKV